MCCSPWGRKELDTTERLNWTDRHLREWGAVLYFLEATLHARTIQRNAPFHCCPRMDAIVKITCSFCGLSCKILNKWKYFKRIPTKFFQGLFSSWLLFLVSSWASLVAQIVKNLSAMAGYLGSIPGSGWFPWRREWLPIPVFLSGRSHGHRSLGGYNLLGCRVRHDWVTNSSLVYTRYWISKCSHKFISSKITFKQTRRES